MNSEMINILIKNIIPIGIILLMLSGFIWSTVLAVSFFIHFTRAKKILGNDFDPAKQIDRRRK
jgi:hypothetical protein